MAVRIEKSGSIWTVIHSRSEARNAMDPDSPEAMQEAFLEFEKGRRRFERTGFFSGKILEHQEGRWDPVGWS